MRFYEPDSDNSHIPVAKTLEKNFAVRCKVLHHAAVKQLAIKQAAAIHDLRQTPANGIGITSASSRKSATGNRVEGHMIIWKASLVALTLCYLTSIMGILASSTAVAASNQLSKLPGRWKGAGSVKFDGGTKEAVKCIATYFVKNGGKSLQQNLRCSTLSSYKISARSELAVSGNRLAGTWVERNSGNEGTVSGKITAHGFNLSVSGAVFTASMRVQVIGTCAQTIRISPTGLGVKRISINLRKC